jgi:hypothetical protein
VREEIILEQYRIAVDLYKHEDLLNWQKFHNLIYVNTALIGMMGVWELIPSDIPRILTISLPVLGIIVSLCFFVTARAGVKYLQARKGTVAAIDEQIKNTTNQTVITLDDPVLKTSPTTKVLTVLPLVLLLFWIIFLVGVLISF